MADSSKPAGSDACPGGSPPSVELLPYPYHVLDEMKEIVCVNEAWLEALGYERTEVEGTPFAEFLTPDAAKQFESAFAELQRTDSSSRDELEVRHADGGTVVASFAGRAERGQRGEVVRAHCQLNTKTPASTSELKRRAIEKAPIGITISNPQFEDNPLVYANRGFEKITGYTAEEAIGRNCRWLQGDQTDPDAVSEIRDGIDSGEAVTAELRNYRKDGTEFWNRVTVAPLHDREGNVTHYVGFQEDITEEKEQREKIRTHLVQAQRIARVGSWWLDIAEGDLHWSKECYRLFGIPEEESMTYERFLERVHPEDRASVRERWNAALDGEKYDVTHRIVVDGDTKWVREVATVTFDENGDPVEGVGVVQDVTERKERERELRRMKQAVESTGHTIYVTDTDGEIEYVNPAFEESTGYTADEAIGETPRLLKSGEHSDEFYQELWETIAAGDVWRREVTNESKAGDRYVVDQTISPIETDAGDIEGYVAVNTDITEDVERKRQLQQYKRAVEESTNMLVAADEEYGIYFANHKYREFHDIPSQADITGCSLQDLVSDEEFEEIQPYIDRALRGETVSFELTVSNADDAERTFRTRYYPLSVDGAVTGFVGAMRDITDRRAREQEIREQRQRYKSLFDSIQDVIVITDADHRIINCNPAFTDLFGYTLEHVRGEPLNYVCGSKDTVLDTAATNGTETVQYEKRSGQSFPGDTRVSRLENSDGDSIGFICLIRDVSDRETRLRQMNVIDRVLRHNLKNNLAVIRSSAETLGQEDSSRDTAHVQRIIDACDRLGNVAANQREITRYLSEPHATDVYDIVPKIETIVSRLQEQYPSAEMTVAQSGECRVRASAEIHRAVEELIENAVRHSDHDHPTVDISVECSGDTVQISVADDGPGIPQMEQEVLLGKAEIEPMYHGSGLGLWLVNLIVRDSDGVLKFTENEPRGSVVTIQLPAGTD